MKIQLALLLVVVLTVSLPSIVLAQPPLTTVQPGETAQTAPTAETVQKSWKGPVFGLGLGLGVRTGNEELISDVFIGTPTTALLQIQARLGYGLSERIVLYGATSSYRLFYSSWKKPYGEGGILFRSNQNSRYYGFFAIGSTLVEDDWGDRYFRVRGGPSIEISTGLSLEAAGTLQYFQNNYDGVSFDTAVLDITFNYHFY